MADTSYLRTVVEAYVPGVGADVYASARAQAQLEHDAQAMIATLSGS